MTNKYLEKIAGREVALHSKIVDGATRTVKSETDKVWKATQAAKNALNTVKKHSGKAALVAGGAGLTAHMYKGLTQKTPGGHNAHTGKALLSHAWQEAAIAKEHGKKMTGSKIKTHVEQNALATLSAHNGSAYGALKGGAIAGLAGVALAAKNGKSLKPAGLIAGSVGAMAGGYSGLLKGWNEYSRKHADKLHEKYKK